MEWIGCVHYKKSRRDFVARTFALIAPVHTVLNRASCSYEMITYEPNHYETYQNMSLGSHGVDWVHSLQKIPILRSTNFCINCTNFVARTFALIAPVHPILRRVSCSYKTIPNAPKHNTMHRIMSLGSNGVDCVRFYKKSRRDFVACTFALIAPVHTVLHRVSCSNETIPNAPKHYATHQNMSLVSNGVDWVRSLRKILTWLRGTNFFINCPSSPYFASSFMELQNDPKCTQTLYNAPKHEFRVQQGGSGVFVGKNYNLT